MSCGLLKKGERVGNQIVAAGIAVAIASVPFLGGATASASVEGFLLEMDTPFAAPAEQLTQGNSLCGALTRARVQQIPAADTLAILVDFQADPAFEGRAAAYVTRLGAAALRELCPENIDFFATATRTYGGQLGEG